MTRKKFEPEKFPMFLKIWSEFFNKNKFDTIYLEKNDSFLQYYKKFIPKEMKKKQITE